MNNAPLLETLTRRLAECPADFLAEPRLGKQGLVQVDAVVSDLMRALGGAALTTEQAAPFRVTNAKQYRNWLSVTLIACWLFSDATFSGGDGHQVYQFLLSQLRELAAVTPAPKFVTDPDRREELARLGLKALDLRPAGETPEQAQDRLATLNSAERQRVIAAARAAEERARQIREALAKKEAEEAADKWTRE